MPSEYGLDKAVENLNDVIIVEESADESEKKSSNIDIEFEAEKNGDN